MTTVQCKQTKCYYHESRGLVHLCPVCSECGATSNRVDENNCVNCWNCISDEGFIRSGKPEKPGIMILEKEGGDLIWQ